ncbi:hypothetical protein WJX81_003068 [Elliptochloris bilobata]|uniref:Uncharacterized protein n=1 Tax=Elliptochloris bilobata TaxID=381761 RepID=A0AAW1SA80_9CHLO
MFYSIELLGKKTALGAVWVAAHGKKLNRNKVMGVNIVETCNKIMDPEVPHALRLQGILVGGVVLIFSKQQAFLLDDCNEMMKKVRAVAANGDSKLLGKGRATARRQAITLPEPGDHEMRLLVQDFDIGFLHVDNGMAGNHNAVVEGDMFIMPAMEPSMAAASEGALGAGGAGQTVDQGLSAMRDMDLDAALHYEQPERFEAGGMDLDLTYDPLPQPNLAINPLPDPTGLAAPKEPPTDLPPPAAERGTPWGTPGGLPGADGADNRHGGAEDGAALQAKGTEVAGAAAQARRRTRKRHGGPIFDEAVIIDSKVIRSWTTDSTELVKPRGRVLPAHAAAAACAQALLHRPAVEAAGAGAQWAPTIARLLEKRVSAPARGSEESAEHFGRAKRKRTSLAPADDVAVGGSPPLPGEGDLGPLEAAPEPDAPAFNDAPLPDGGLPYGDDDGMELLRALSTPGSHGNARLGITPGSSNPLGPGSVQARHSRPSSGKRPSSGDGQPSDRWTPSDPGSRRLSNVEEGGAPGVEGALDDLLPLDEALEGGPDADALTQFQAGGGSLLEESASATQTQVAGTPPDAQARARGLAHVLRERFAKAKELSLFALTASMTRKQAACLFYQVCVMNAGNLVKACQVEPYDDITICSGAML